MATIDLSSYKLSELKGLQHDIEREIKDRQQSEVKKAREQILSMAQELGVSIEELLGSGVAKKTKGVKAAAQYRNPADENQTWSGRGRQPLWIGAAVKEGKSLDDFRIKQ